MTAATRAALEKMADPEYKAFQQKLLPGVENYLGVRLPLLQKTARRLAAGSWEKELAEPDKTYEETMLRGLVIARASLPPARRFALLKEFVPTINNWGVCDSVCAALRETNEYKSECIELIKQYVYSKREFEARFAAVMLLWHYADAEDLRQSLALYEKICQPDWYARMAVAWGYSVFAATDFEATLAAMTAARLDDFTWNKALQKMRESNRITPAHKARVKKLKRGGK